MRGHIPDDATVPTLQHPHDTALPEKVQSGPRCFSSRAAGVYNSDMSTIDRSDGATKQHTTSAMHSQAIAESSQLSTRPDSIDNDADSPAASVDADASDQKPPPDSNARQLNPRSCITCRRRKVRCDKTHPCANCTRQHIECIFPAPGRAPRRLKKVVDGRDKELLERLRRLEGVVKGLGVEVPELDTDNAPKSKPDAAEDEPVEGGSRHRNLHDGSRLVEELAQARFENRFGRLVINDGKSRYVNSSFWANLSNEVEDLKGILNQGSEDEDEDATDDYPNASKNHQEFIFGFSSQNVDLLVHHPLPEQIPLYWRIFKENVDPVVKVLHLPTVEPTVLSAASHLGVLSRSFEALMFVIYYGATTTLNPDDCITTFGESKPLLLARYRFAVEQSLARANFLITEELIVLQAFIVFLICLRKNSGARIIWTLTGLVVRMAQTMGVHRDGTHFNLTPFETEMRRRAWWQICLLDTRASEDHGCDPTIVEQAFDTKLPLNINDSDISPDSKTFPPERQGCVDITFSLIRFEVANTFRRINYIPPGPAKACMNVLTSVTLEEKEKWITESHQRLEEKYLKNCDMTVPLYWVTATVARLIMSKMWLMVYHPFQRKDGGHTLPQETKDKLFITSLENMEYSILLETEVRTQKWSWLFKTYMQWHALAFILTELCHRTKGDLVERAWVAVEKMRRGRWGDTVSAGTSGGHLWRPLRKLYRKALGARIKGMQEEQLEKQHVAGSIPSRTYSPNANPMFGHPRRPQMTRAPLSQAQLDRFTQGPVFGERPLDSHQLLRSPRGSDAGGEKDVDPTAESKRTVLSAPSPIRINGAELSEVYDPRAYDVNASALQNNSQAGVGTTVDRPLFGSRFLAPAAPIDFSGLDVPLDNQFMGTNSGMAGSTPDSFQLTSTDNGLDAIMDTNGEMNWENWDQLVQQYGMDVDQSDGSGAGWTNTNWNTAGLQGQQAMRLGNGWFI